MIFFFGPHISLMTPSTPCLVIDQQLVSSGSFSLSLSISLGFSISLRLCRLHFPLRPRPWRFRYALFGCTRASLRPATRRRPNTNRSRISFLWGHDKASKNTTKKQQLPHWLFQFPANMRYRETVQIMLLIYLHLHISCPVLEVSNTCPAC